MTVVRGVERGATGDKSRRRGLQSASPAVPLEKEAGNPTSCYVSQLLGLDLSSSPLPDLMIQRRRIKIQKRNLFNCLN